jgi:hypothetical protein
MYHTIWFHLICACVIGLRERQLLLGHLQHQPEVSWPLSWHWKFMPRSENPSHSYWKLWGTPMLDAYMLREQTRAHAKEAAAAATTTTSTAASSGGGSVPSSPLLTRPLSSSSTSSTPSSPADLRITKSGGSATPTTPTTPSTATGTSVAHNADYDHIASNHLKKVLRRLHDWTPIYPSHTPSTTKA